MIDKLEKLRRYNRFKNRLPAVSIWLPWVRSKIRKSIKKTSYSELIRTESGFLIPVDSAESATRRIQVRGTIDPSMEWVIRRYAKPGTVSVDVGANLGFLSLLMAERVGVTGEVVALEPNMQLHGYIRRLLHLNAIENVSLLSYACSDKKGVVRFSVDSNDHTMSKITESGGREIDTMPLDLILAAREKPVSFIKVDVEGFEPEVLRGALKILQSDRPVLVFETGTHSKKSVAEINKTLEEASYDVVGVINDWGIEECLLTVDVTDKSHCNILALPRQINA